jgi:hypothetical protein
LTENNLRCFPTGRLLLRKRVAVIGPSDFGQLQQASDDFGVCRGHVARPVKFQEDFATLYHTSASTSVGFASSTSAARRAISSKPGSTRYVT